MKRKILLTERFVGAVPAPLPRVRILVRTRYGDFVPVRVVLDTGSDCCGLPLGFATAEGIPVPRTPQAHGTAGGLVGSAQRYRGPLAVQIAGEWFIWPCDFLDAPVGSGALVRDGVIERAGFLQDFD